MPTTAQSPSHAAPAQPNTTADALVGDTKRFTRQDGVEEASRVMQTLLDTPPPVHPYEQRTWDPDAAEDLITGYGRWYDPWVR